MDGYTPVNMTSRNQISSDDGITYEDPVTSPFDPAQSMPWMTPEERAQIMSQARVENGITHLPNSVMDYILKTSPYKAGNPQSGLENLMQGLTISALTYGFGAAGAGMFGAGAAGAADSFFPATGAMSTTPALSTPGTISFLEGAGGATGPMSSTMGLLSSPATSFLSGAAGGAVGALSGGLEAGVNPGGLDGSLGDTGLPASAPAETSLMDTVSQTAKDVWGNPIGKQLIQAGGKALISGALNGGGGSSQTGAFNSQLSNLLNASNLSTSTYGGSTAAPLATGTPDAGAIAAPATLIGSRGAVDPAGTLASMDRAASVPIAGTIPAPSMSTPSQNGAVNLRTRPVMHV